MTHVNKKNVTLELREAAWMRFGKTIGKPQLGNDIFASISKFLTPSEITLIEKRLLISLLLEKGLSYRKIGEMLDVSRVTISFVKHNLKRTPRIPREHKPNKKNKNDTSLLMTPMEHMRRLHRT